MLSFEEVKKVRITDIVGRYGIKLRFKGEWASAPCPLPTHKTGDKGKNFTINLAQNYWRCWSESCNQKNGGKRGGDCITFVALMEHCRERDAAQKIADWYGLSKTLTAQPKARNDRVNGESCALREPLTEQKNAVQNMSERREGSGSTLHEDSLEPSSSRDSVKGGYLHDLSIQMEALLCVIADEMIRKQVKKEVMNAIYDSYKNGKAAR